MKIFIDYDTTLNNFDHCWFKWLLTEHNIKVNHQDVLYWNYITDTYGQDKDDFWKNPDIYRNDIVQPRKGAQDFIKQLQYENKKIAILTSSYPGTEQAKDEHIQRHFGNIEIIHSHDKPTVTKDSILIDDNVLTVRDHCLQNQMPGIVFDNCCNGWSRSQLICDDLDKIKNLIYFRYKYYSMINFLMTY